MRGENAHDNIPMAAKVRQSCACAQTLERRTLTIDKPHALAVLTLLCYMCHMCYTDERSPVAVWNSHAPQVISSHGIVEGTHDQSHTVIIAEERPHVLALTTLAVLLG